MTKCKAWSRALSSAPVDLLCCLGLATVLPSSKLQKRRMQLWAISFACKERAQVSKSVPSGRRSPSTKLSGLKPEKSGKTCRAHPQVRQLPKKKTHPASRIFLGQVQWVLGAPGAVGLWIWVPGDGLQLRPPEPPR